MRRVVADLGLGMRLGLTGSRARLVMIVSGIALGVAMLLSAASVPNMVAARSGREAAREWSSLDSQPPRGPDTLLVRHAGSQFRDHDIRGVLLQPEGDRAPLPPGVSRPLAPGEMAVSPALDDLLRSPDGRLLRGRWDERVVATIAPAGLDGPGELAFYLGTDRLTADDATRIRAFGTHDQDSLPVFLTLLLTAGVTVLLLPVAIFVATAARFGGESRDRQLAALRLLGADPAMTRRVAAGETLVGALLGLVAGTGLFLVVRPLVPRLSMPGMSFYAADARPVPMLAALVAVLVPAVAVLVTLFALRQVVVEPFGVTRRGVGRPRRLAWRLLLPAAGVALVCPLLGGVPDDAGATVIYQLAAGVIALLLGSALLMPWLVQAVVRRLGAGPVAWQLAVRRLQLDGGTAVRAVSGIVVAVAGAIALQAVLSAASSLGTVDTGEDPTQVQEVLALPARAATVGPQLAGVLRTTPGVLRFASTRGILAESAGPGGESVTVYVGDCGALQPFATLGRCTDGDAFLVSATYRPAPSPATAYRFPLDAARRTTRLWTPPAGTRTAPAREVLGTVYGYADLLLTPAALGRLQPYSFETDYQLHLDPADRDAHERVRTAASRLDPRIRASAMTDRQITGQVAQLRQGLQLGAIAALLLAGASLLVNVVEQLRDRRRQLAVLSAFGTRRSTLGWSVLAQTAVPVLLGLALAVVTGAGVGAVLLSVVQVRVHVDWSGVAGLVSAGAATVLGTTAASLPLLWRLTRPGELRTE